MRTKEVRESIAAEILDREKQSKEELLNLRFQLVTDRLENTARIKEVRQPIVRIKTVLRERAN